MNVILFFTYGVSLKTWESTGLLSREMELYNQLSKKYDIKFTFVTYGDKHDYQYEDYFENLKILPIYALSKYSNSKAIRILKTLIIPFRLKKLIGKEKVIIKSNQMYGAWVPIIFKLISRNALIVRTGYDLLEFSIKEKKNILKLLMYYLLTLFALNISDIYISTSQYDIKNLQKRFIFKRKKLVHIPNWVPIIDNNAQEIPNKKIIMVGRIEYQKRFDLVLNLLGNTSFNVDIFGEGKLKKELQKKSELFDNVNFHQKINNEDLLNKYSEYSFYLSLSDYEGNSKTILEALGSGCIVIASNIPNNLEIISNGSNGFIFENSKENLIKLLDRIINDPGTMMKISKEAKAYIERNNSIEVILNKEFEILTKLV
tara:strand:+ start:6456 stop:7571 length:1116 start_codon:yes stop_codon:yes gene_type:complete